MGHQLTEILGAAALYTLASKEPDMPDPTQGETMEFLITGNGTTFTLFQERARRKSETDDAFLEREDRLRWVAGRKTHPLAQRWSPKSTLRQYFGTRGEVWSIMIFGGRGGICLGATGNEKKKHGTKRKNQSTPLFSGQGVRAVLLP